MENNSSKWGLIKKALYIWIVQYHGIIPKEILKGYIHKYKHESENIAKYGKRFFDPSVREEYQQWLSYQQEPVSENTFEDITIIGKNVGVINKRGLRAVSMEHLDLRDIDTTYVCLASENVHLYPTFFAVLNELDDCDIVYFDHDLRDENGRYHPVCKPDFSYDTLHGFNYIGNLVIVKKSVLEQFSGKVIDMYRWLLELSDQSVCWKHISKICYGDSQEEKFDFSTLQDYFETKNQNVVLEDLGDCAYVHYPVVGSPKVSIVIPTKDGKEILKTCVDSILNRSTYENYEILIIDNKSEKEETISYFHALQSEHDNIHVERMEVPFNFSLLNNRMILNHATGEYVVLLNNDTEIITCDWLEKMLSYAQLEHVGSVGVKLYYGDGTIQHGGVIAGKGGGFAHRYYRKPHDEKGYLHTLEVPNDVFCCTAACLMIPMVKYREVGGMNEEMAVQFNDVELGIKLLEKGYCNVFLPDVELFHYESKSRGIDKKQEAVDRYVEEVEFVQRHFGSYIEHDPYYNDAFDKNYDYMLKSGTGSN